MTYFKFVFLLFCISFVYGEDAPVVGTTQGQVRGLAAEDGNYYMYLGIPYGTVDLNNPFGPSSPAPQFEDVFNATDDSAQCPQASLGSLDCLHLNIFTPRSRTTLLPVLIFVHGGAFEFGSFGRTLYGPKYLVRHDVILITLNYRLGAYGFMCTNSPRVPGNQALKDQLLALKWVNENIENFGGDPNRVTLSGNSAGGMSTDVIIASDEGPKYFQQAILQSGVAFLPSYGLPDARDAPLRLAEHFNLPTNDMDEALDFLATIEPSRIIAASQQLGFQFRPCIERSFEGVDAFMTENWVSKEVVQAEGLNVMLGFTDNEALGLFLTPNSDLTNIVEQSLIGSFATEHEDFTGQSEVKQFFFGDEEIDQSMFKEAIDLRSDNAFVHHTIRSLRRLLKSGAENVFLYLFTYDGDRNLLKWTLNTTVEGAAHADEIGYLFDVLAFGEPNIEDQLVVDRMTAMWTNFVKYGNPTPTPTALVPITWQPISPTSPLHYIHIDSQLYVATSLYNERMAFWDLFLELNGHLQRLVLSDHSD